MKKIFVVALLASCLALHAQETRQAFRIPFGNLCSSDAATIRAARAIDLLLHILGDPFEPPLYKRVVFQPRAELLILRALLFAKAFDLDKIGEHFSQYRNKSFCAKFVFFKCRRGPPLVVPPASRSEVNKISSTHLRVFHSQHRSPD